MRHLNPSASAVGAVCLALTWTAGLQAGDLRVTGQFISEATSGPPLAVASPDLVANLNADHLDGFDIGDFASAGSGVGVHYKNLVGVPGEEIDQDCAVNTGCFAGDSPGFPVTITAPGTYRMAGNLTLSASGNALEVAADHVSIDLAGFTLDGGGAGTNGIYALDRSNVEIRNGAITSFASSGILADGSDTHGFRLIDMRVGSNSSYGIFLFGDGHYVSRCAVSNNGGPGLFVSKGGTITHNVANGNGGRGITATNASIVDNTASFNGTDGIRGTDSNIIGNTTNNNERIGIDCNAGKVENNVASGNNDSNSTSGGGIRIQGNCYVHDNSLDFNNQASINATTFSGSVIVENRLFGSDRGLWLQSSGNFYDNNWAANNTTDYDVAAGNTDGGGNISY